MKYITKLVGAFWAIILTLTLLLSFSNLAFSQEGTSVAPLPPANGLESFILQFIYQWPMLSTVVMLMGTLRLLIKPVIELLRKFVTESPSQEDDRKLAYAESSWWFKAFMFLLDWGASIKPITPKK